MANLDESLARDAESLDIIQNHATEAALPTMREWHLQLPPDAELQKWLVELAGAVEILSQSDLASTQASPNRPSGLFSSLGECRHALVEALDGWDGSLDEEQVRERAFRLGQTIVSAWLDPILEMAEQQAGGILEGNLLPVDDTPRAEVVEGLEEIKRKYDFPRGELERIMTRFARALFNDGDYVRLSGEAGMLAASPLGSTFEDERKIFVASHDLLRKATLTQCDRAWARSMADAWIIYVKQFAQSHGTERFSGLASLCDARFLASLPNDTRLPSLAGQSPFKFLLTCAEERLFEESDAVMLPSGVELRVHTSGGRNSNSNLPGLHSSTVVTISARSDTHMAPRIDGLPRDPVEEITRAFTHGVELWSRAAKTLD